MPHFPFSKSVEILLHDGTVFSVTDWSVNFKSSAKRRVLELILSGRSFINRRKSKGPSTDS